MNRRFLTCPECGWVHYVMATAEKVAGDLVIERYHLNEVEQQIYGPSCSNAYGVKRQRASFVRRAMRTSPAAGHVVTPVFVGVGVGTQ
jgi:hypothetical protein